MELIGREPVFSPPVSVSYGGCRSDLVLRITHQRASYWLLAAS